MLTENSTLKEAETELVSHNNVFKQNLANINTSLINKGLSSATKYSEVPTILSSFSSTPSITDGYVGYANDTDGNEYDIDSLGYYYYKDSSTIINEGSRTLSSMDLHVFKNGNYIVLTSSDVIGLYNKMGNSMKALNSDGAKGNVSKFEKLTMYDDEYIALRFTKTPDSVELYDSGLNLLRTFDASDLPAPSHGNYSSYAGLFFLVNYSSSFTNVAIYDFYTCEKLKDLELTTNNNSQSTILADYDYIYHVAQGMQITLYDRKDYSKGETYQPTTGTLKIACYFGDKKIFVASTAGYGVVFDVKLKKPSVSRMYSSSSNLRCFPDGFFVAVTVDQRYFKVDDQNSILYQHSSMYGSANATYSYPYWYQSTSNTVYMMRDQMPRKLIAKAKKRG